MKPTSKTLSWAFVIILLAVGIFTGLGVILMHKQPLVLQGQAEATEIRISGKLPGRIDTFFVQEGDWVHRGDTLVVINSPEVHAKYQQVNALEQVAVQQNKKIDAGTRRQIVATALQLWNKTKSDLTLAQTTYNRILTLYKDSVITSQRKDEVPVDVSLRLCRQRWRSRLLQSAERKPGTKMGNEFFAEYRSGNSSFQPCEPKFRIL